MGAVVLAGFLLAVSVLCDDSEEYLDWSASQAKDVGKVFRRKTRFGYNIRMLRTERAESYELMATWMTPEVIRASARLDQLRNRLSNDHARKMVAQAEEIEGIVVLIELDPSEGSGVIPSDWGAYLQPRGNQPGSGRAVQGVNKPELRHLPALRGVFERDYDYDQFWLVFPLAAENGLPLFSLDDQEAELIVRIRTREGRLRFFVPHSVKGRSSGQAHKQVEKPL